MLLVSGSRREEIGFELLDTLSSLAVDTEGQMARFVAKTLRVCSKLVVITYWTPIVAVTGEVSFGNRILNIKTCYELCSFHSARSVSFWVLPFGAKLSEPHTYETALYTCVYVCLLAC